MPRSNSRARSPSNPPPAGGLGRIQVFLRSLDHRVVDQAAARLTAMAERAGALIEGPIPLPSQPSAVDGMRAHVRRLDLIDPPPKLLAILQHFDLPTGVEIEMVG